MQTNCDTITKDTALKRQFSLRGNKKEATIIFYVPKTHQKLSFKQIHLAYKYKKRCVTSNISQLKWVTDEVNYMILIALVVVNSHCFQLFLDLITTVSLSSHTLPRNSSLFKSNRYQVHIKVTDNWVFRKNTTLMAEEIILRPNDLTRYVVGLGIDLTFRGLEDHTSYQLSYRSKHFFYFKPTCTWIVWVVCDWNTNTNGWFSGPFRNHLDYPLP